MFQLKENHDSVFYFLLFLRMFPMSPNWLMNIIAPIVGVPLRYFFLTVLIGEYCLLLTAHTHDRASCLFPE